MYKLVLLDLDGTLLTSDKIISEFNCSVIHDIKDKAKVILVSARSFNRIKPYLEQLHLCDSDNYTIAFNGGIVSDNLENRILDNKIKKGSLFQLYDFLRYYTDYTCSFYTYEQCVSTKEIENIKDFISKYDIYKVVCLNDEDSIQKLRLSIPNEIFNLFEITCSESTRIEFVEKGNTKENAIEKLLRLLSIDKKDVIAIGDGENDIGMLEYVGCGVAMGNANDEVKSHAKLITDTNDNDGVGKILIQLIVEK